MGFVGNEGEAASLSLMAEIAGECARFGMPLIAEVLPAAADHFQDPEWIGLAARAASEIGADVIKAYVTGTEADEGMIRTCGAPFLAAGGPKAADPVELAASAIRRGASGIAFGRNVFEAEDPRSTVRDLCRAVHDGG
jgi:DhnA family fructose-bisphosphate aldolase class Ia